MRATLATLVFAMLALVPATAQEKTSVEAATNLVQEELDRLKANGFVMQQVKDESVGRTFPKHVFFGVYFRQFPVARLTPKGLSASNVFAVGPNGKLQLLKEAKQLQDFAKANLTLAKGAESAKDAARAYVRLMEDLHQDGFFKFSLQDDSTKVKVSKEGTTATARAVVMAGGNGELGTALTFDGGGSLQRVAETVQLKPGPRPICQATKLLDADPVVRRMAEQDLLIMGRAARPYLDEQRAKASAPLQRAIDSIRERIVKEDP
jgi:hypothetical protein